MYCIETSLENQSFFSSLVETYPSNVTIMKKNSFILDGDNLQVFLTLSPVMIGGLCQAITALINAQKEFTFKDGKGEREYSFKGFSEKKIYDFLKNLNNIEDK